MVCFNTQRGSTLDEIYDAVEAGMTAAEAMGEIEASIDGEDMVVGTIH